MGPEPEVLRDSLDTLADVFYIYDEQLELVVWNDRLNELFDLTDAELRGMMPVEFFRPEDRPAVEAAVSELFETGETVVEARAETTEGTIRFELSGHLLTDGAGEFAGFCGIGRDVTEYRKQTRTLAAQNDRLEQFASLLAHDVRNPLNVAAGYVDVAMRTGETGDLDRAVEALDRIEQIVDDVLVVALEGQTATEKRPTSVAAVARDAWETVATADATLAVRTDVTVDCDRSRLRRLFENLFRNAVEHGSTSPPSSSTREDAVEHGGPAVTVTVEGTPDGFAVADDGPGVDPTDRERLFDPGISTAAAGTGFGLYIVRTIAEAHGWTVALTESDSGGARFEFCLVPDPDDARELAPDPAGRESDPADRESDVGREHGPADRGAGPAGRGLDPAGGDGDRHDSESLK